MNNEDFKGFVMTPRVRKLVQVGPDLSSASQSKQKVPCFARYPHMFDSIQGSNTGEWRQLLHGEVKLNFGKVSLEP